MTPLISERLMPIQEAAIVRVNGQRCIVLPSDRGLSVHPLPEAALTSTPAPPTPILSVWDNPTQFRFLTVIGCCVAGFLAWTIVIVAVKPAPVPGNTTVIVQPPPPPQRHSTEKCFLVWCERRETY